MGLTLDKILLYLALILLCFFTPLLLFANKVDSTTETYVADRVNTFVNRSCATGIITSAEYEEMINGLDATGIAYNIYLIHSNEKVSPTVKEDGSLEYNACDSYYEEYRNDEIYNVLFPEDGTTDNKKYYLNEGDYLRIVVENSSPTLGRRLFGMITFGDNDSKSIMVSRGDYVGHEADVRE